MRANKFTMTAAVALACIGAIFAVNNFRPNPELVLKQRMAERAEGDEKAKIWVTEYFDYQCPPCAQSDKILKELMEKNPGRIYLQVRYFPLPGHQNAMKAAIHAECVSRQKGKFWKYHHAVLAAQNEWAKDTYAQIRFASYAKDVGVDLGRLDHCVHDPAVETAVQEEKKTAQGLGVQITPTFFVNGKLLVGYTDMRAEVEKLLQS